ncbi:MAG: carboxypeptidase-like regulatory domain-containing protein, partial [Mucilaginibacter sp.]
MVGSIKSVKAPAKAAKKPVPPVNIKGKVIDRVTGETLIGVSVKIKNTSVGTVTDVDGNFTLAAVPDNAVLVVSYIGYDPAEVPVEGRSS